MGRSSTVVLTLADVARPLLLRALLVVLTLTVALRSGPFIVTGFREFATFGIGGMREARRDAEGEEVCGR